MTINTVNLWVLQELARADELLQQPPGPSPLLSFTIGNMQKYLLEATTPDYPLVERVREVLPQLVAHQQPPFGPLGGSTFAP